MTEKVGLEAVLDLKQFSRNFKEYQKSVDSMNSGTLSAVKSMDNAFTSFGGNVLKVAGIAGGVLVAGVGAAAAAMTAFAVDGVKMAVNLEEQMSAIQAVLGATTEESARLKQGILDLGLDPRLKVNAQEAADAIQLLARNGLDVNEILGETGDIADSAAFATVLLANATGADFAVAADIATDAMAVFNIETTDMIDAVSSIISVTTESKFTINDYSLALRNGGAAANEFGISLAEFNTVVALSAEELGTGMKAGTGFRNFLMRITPNTENATQAMRDLGLITADGTNIFFDAAGNLKEMDDVAVVLNQALYGTSSAMVEVGGRTADQNRTLSELTKQYDKAQQTITDYQTGVKGITLSDDKRNERIQDQIELMAALSPKIDELNGVRGQLVETTNTLTAQERAVAIETIFGADAMNTAIAIAKEGEPAFKDVGEVMRVMGVTFSEAQAIMDSGITKFELLYNEMSDVDAVEQAQIRMQNLASTMEIIGGIVDTVKIQVGDAFIPVLQLLADKLTVFVDDVGPKVVETFEKIAGFIGTFVDGIIEGQSPLEAFFDTLASVGLGDIALQLNDIRLAVIDFVEPIIAFVDQHSDAFIGAIEGIGAVLAGAAIAAVLAGIAGALLSLINPITFIIIAAGALGAAWNTNFWGIRDTATEVGAKLKPIFDNITGGLEELRKSAIKIGEKLTPVFDDIIDLLSELKDAFDTGGVEGVFLTLSDKIAAIDWLGLGKQIIDKILQGFSTLGTQIGTFLANVVTIFTNWVNTVDWSAVGGIVVDGIIYGLGAIIGLIALQVMAWYNAISGFVTAADWITIGTNLVTAIITGLESFIEGAGESILKWNEVFLEWAGYDSWEEIGNTIVQNIITGFQTFTANAQETLAGWKTTFDNWVASIDWVALAVTIVTDILLGLNQFTVLILETFLSWHESFTNWIDSIDWLQLGNDIVGFILDGLLTFVENSVETFGEWLASFNTWIEGVDWVQLGHDIVIAFIDGLKLFQTEVVEPLEEWFASFTDWRENTDFETEGKNIVDAVIVGVATFPTLVGATLAGWYTAISTWISSQDWSALGASIVQGIFKGLGEAATNVKNAAGELAEGAEEGFKDAAEIQSPSKVFEDLGMQIGIGAAIGIETGGQKSVEAIKQLMVRMADTFDFSNIISKFESAFEFGKGISTFGKTIASKFEKDVIDPMQERNKTLSDTLKETADTIKRETGLEANDINLPEIVAIARSKSVAEGGTISIAAVVAANQYVNAYKQRQELAEQIRVEEEKILKLQEQQQQFQFLQQQLNFLDFLKDAGINASEVLGGFELGLNADLGGLLQIMSNAMQQVVLAAEDELGIASPSKVFARLGEYSLEGFTEGFLSASGSAINAIKGFTDGMVNSVTPFSNSGGVVTNDNSTNVNFQGNFAGNPTITDKSQMEFILASVR